MIFAVVHVVTLMGSEKWLGNGPIDSSRSYLVWPSWCYAPERTKYGRYDCFLRFESCAWGRGGEARGRAGRYMVQPRGPS